MVFATFNLNRSLLSFLFTWALYNVYTFLLGIDIIEDSYLKVVGNEKKGGLRFLQLLGISLGLWRLMSISF